MQQVAQVTTHPISALPSARTTQNKQYNNTSPGCAAINLVVAAKASAARQRCRYMIGTMKPMTNAHARTRRPITCTHHATADIRYTL